MLSTLQLPDIPRAAGDLLVLQRSFWHASCSLADCQRGVLRVQVMIRLTTLPFHHIVLRESGAVSLSVCASSSVTGCGLEPGLPCWESPALSPIAVRLISVKADVRASNVPVTL